MKRLLLALLASAFLFAANAQTLLPVRDSIGKLSISVDPRMELLGAVQVVAGYPLSTHDTPYSDRVQARFGAFANSNAAKITKKMLRNGFAYDAPAGLMLYYSFPLELKLRQPYSEYLEKRSGGERKLRRYRVAMKNFAEKSDFAGFWNENDTFYRQLLEQCKNTVGDVNIIDLLESYFNKKQKSYHIILCPLFGNNNYGPRLFDQDDRLDIYALLSVPQNQNGPISMKYGSRQGLLLHEFSHSFVNPLVEQHIDLIAPSNYRFEPIREQMRAQAYGNWITCVMEHVVRAVGVRLAEMTGGAIAAEKAFRYEESRYFGYIRPLVAKLHEYEALRDSIGITFADYVSELLQVFNEAELYKPRFQGPANAVLSGKKVVFVHPTVGDGAAKVTEYVHWLVDWINSRSQLESPLSPVADSVAVKMPLDSCNIVCYGTVESNLLLAKYRSKLPFRVEPGAIIADRRYDDPEVRLIACMPNPENPELGMAVYTALDERRLIDINNVFHGPEDFYIFTDRDHILSHGYFEKRGADWRFPQPQP